MNYRYKNFNFSTECEFYKILAADINEPYIRECRGVCTIYFPKALGGVNRQMSEFQNILFTYSKTIYRLKSIDPVSVTIVQINDLGETLLDYSPSYIHLLTNSLTKELLQDSLLQSELFEVWRSSRSQEFQYKELVNFFLNKTSDLNQIVLPNSPITLIDTKDRYSLDFTHSMYALYDRLEIELNKYGFYLKNLNKTEETSTREVATLQFDAYPEDYFKLYPNVNNEMTSYRIPARLILNTSSVSKFERLLSEYNSLKFLSNIPRIYLEDKFERVWVASIKWDTDVDTNPTNKAENDRSESSYYIGINLEYEFCTTRNCTYSPIRKMLLNIKNNE